MMTPKEFRKLHVVVIDDEAFIIRILTQLLRDIGVESIYQARDGKDGLGILEIHIGDIDLVLCDLEMPEMNGLRFIRKVRSHGIKSIAKTPIIVITAHAKDSIVQDAIDLNIQGYLVKPVSKKALIEQIVRAMNTAWMD